MFLCLIFYGEVTSGNVLFISEIIFVWLMYWILFCLLQSVDLGTHLSSLLDRYQQYQDEAAALDSWLSAQEQNQSILKPCGEQTDTQTLQNTLNTVQVRLATHP